MRPVNLLPGDQRRRRPSGEGNNGAYAVIGVLAVLLAMVGFYVMTTNKVNENKTQTAQAKAKADSLEAQTRQLGAFTTFAGIKETRLTSVESVASSRFDWERMMRELSRVMPPGSWLTSVDAGVTGANGDNSASSQDQGAPAQPAAELVGCASHQTDTAKMMVRLRQLHRVDDVKLNQSAKGTEDTSGNSLGCGKRVQFDLTVEFSASAPKEAPRGAHAVPASLGGGS
ncbi:MAG TPA: PilN domain-containing protein [Thermoleophilaceae bacterium]|nr:PilN domain-containing protein [Thermoleophilaceae bacterium]